MFDKFNPSIFATQNKTIMKTNSIGLDAAKAKKLSGKLNTLLATYQVYYQNLRGFHWNIKGADFFELHVKFEELYSDAQLKIDEIAERILTLESTPFHSFATYLKESGITPVEGLTEGTKMVVSTLANLQQLLLQERELLKMAEDADDEGTSSLMSDYISQQEKLIWMLKSYSKK